MDPGNDQWFYSELVPSAGGSRRTYQVRFASDPEYATKLQACSNLGMALGADEPDAPVILFSFRSARGRKDAHGRHLRLTVTSGAAGKLSGSLALEVRMSREGAVLGKRLLFATNSPLGDTVLAHIDDWVSVDSIGSDAGPFDDQFFLQFDAGVLTMATESHRIEPAMDA
jgi:hypothetical protein